MRSHQIAYISKHVNGDGFLLTHIYIPQGLRSLPARNRVFRTALIESFQLFTS